MANYGGAVYDSSGVLRHRFDQALPGIYTFLIYGGQPGSATFPGIYNYGFAGTTRVGDGDQGYISVWPGITSPTLTVSSDDVVSWSGGTSGVVSLVVLAFYF